MAKLIRPIYDPGLAADREAAIAEQVRHVRAGLAVVCLGPWMLPAAFPIGFVPPLLRYSPEGGLRAMEGIHEKQFWPYN